MTDPLEKKLKAEIDNIMVRINQIMKKIETNEPDNDRDSKQNRDCAV
jgi:hypothetical protein